MNLSALRGSVVVLAFVASFCPFSRAEQPYLAQLATDFMYPATDQWAHAGGLVAGTIAGIALSPVEDGTFGLARFGI